MYYEHLATTNYHTAIPYIKYICTILPMNELINMFILFEQIDVARTE